VRSRSVTRLTRPCRSCPGTTTTGRLASTRRGHPASVPRSGCHRFLDEPEPMALVEAPRRNVLLKDPQPEPRRQPFLGSREQRTTDAAAQEIWTDVEMLHDVSVHGDEATDLTVRLGDEHVLIAQDDVGDEVERLLVRVDVRKERQCRLGGKEEPGDRIGILASRWSDPQPFVHSPSMPVRLNQGLEVAAEGRGVSGLLPPNRQNLSGWEGAAPPLATVARARRRRAGRARPASDLGP
jgi:hypothetical protein